MPNEYVMKISVFSRNIIMGALWKSLLATILFVVFYLLYSIEIVRSNVEDVAFDTVNKFSIHKNALATDTPHVLLFAFDDLYMKKHQLFDEDNMTTYGGFFPRNYIADFIANLDAELAHEDFDDIAPKALFIDYDMSFSTMPDGKTLSKEDKQLLEVLAKEHSYVILLAKTQKANFVEFSHDKAIQRAIRERRIVFVSVPLLKSSDNTVRRYRSQQSFGQKHPTEHYMSSSVTLWQILTQQPSVNPFKEKDIIGNRIFLKAYTQSENSDECVAHTSQWKQLKKYSASCPLYEIEEFDGGVILLGGTHSQNDDRFSVLSVLGDQSYTGIDIHANALMTMLHLGGSLERLSLGWSLMIVFMGFFILDSVLTLLFRVVNYENEKLSFLFLLFFSTLLFLSLSVYFLNVHQLWFNWFVPMILFQILEMIFLIRKKSPKALLKIFKHIRN